MPSALANMRQSWSRSHRTSFWLVTPRPWGRCNRRPTPYRLYSQVLLTRLVPASSKVWRAPGGHTTGFTQFEYGLSGKWLELLKEVAPSLTRVAVLRGVTIAETGEFAAIQTVAPSLGVEVSPLGTRDAGEIERGISDFARSPNGGLIVAAGASAIVHRELITRLAAQHRLPAIYPYRSFVTAGGLVCYGPDRVDPFRRAAAYVDRILKGEKASDLPVQAPNKYELVINLKAAKSIGLTIPPSVLARADEVIE